MSRKQVALQFQDATLQADFERDIQSYITELNTDSVVSRSHHTLHALNTRYGKSRVEAVLDAHWASLRGAA